MLVLTGQKTVWIGGKEDGILPFLDSAGRRWVPHSDRDDSTTSHFWDLADHDASDGEDDVLVFARKMQAFRRATVGPGDALLIPMRFLHAVATGADTVSISAVVKVKK
jgi:hypothetical protein